MLEHMSAFFCKIAVFSAFIGTALFALNRKFAKDTKNIKLINDDSTKTKHVIKLKKGDDKQAVAAFDKKNIIGPIIKIALSVLPLAFKAILGISAKKRKQERKAKMKKRLITCLSVMTIGTLAGLSLKAIKKD